MRWNSNTSVDARELLGVVSSGCDLEGILASIDAYRQTALGMLAALAGALTGGCRAPEPALPGFDLGEVLHAPQVSTPACTALRDTDGVVLVNGREAGLRASRYGGRVTVFPWDEHSILMAVSHDEPWQVFDPWLSFNNEIAGVLWHVPCDAPHLRSVALRVDYADFGWAVLSPDLSMLYYGGKLGGVHQYEFATAEHERVGWAPPIEGCYGGQGQMQPREFIVGWLDGDDDALLVVSGGPCGKDGRFVGQGVVIEAPDKAATRRGQDFVATVIADTNGRLWVGDGGRCVTQETSLDRGHPGLWSSIDMGETWTYSPIEQLQNGVRGVWAAASEPELLVAWEACCDDPGSDECIGGALVRSEDGGASWRVLEPDRGRFEQVIVGPELREAFIDVDLGASGRALYLTHDGGQTWEEQPFERLEPQRGRRQVEVGGRYFFATDDGLVRDSGTKRTFVLRPNSRDAPEPDSDAEAD